MVNMKHCALLVLVLCLTVNGDYCVDETNEFRVVELDVSESSRQAGQVLVTVSGYFKLPQHVTMMTIDYTLDGINWQKAIKRVNEDFEADTFTSFNVGVGLQGSVYPNAEAVISFSEDNKLVWCTLANLSTSYASRRLVS